MAPASSHGSVFDPEFLVEVRLDRVVARQDSSSATACLASYDAERFVNMLTRAKLTNERKP